MKSEERKLRIRIGYECLKKKWRNDYLTSCSSRYDFVRCPDDFEYMEQYTQDFEYDCYNVETGWNCEECWKKFLRGNEEC